MRMRFFPRYLAVPLVLCGCAAHSALPQAAAPAAPRQKEALAELDRTEQAWLRAYETHDARAMDAILAPSFSITYPGGRVLGRTDVIAQVSRPVTGPTPRFTTEAVETREFAGFAVRTGVLVTETSRGRTRNRYTDTWVKSEGGWRVLASHLSAAE